MSARARALTVLAAAQLAECKWRTLPSTFSAPSTFENVCVGRDDEHSPPKIYFAAPAGTEAAGPSYSRSTPPPQSVSLGTSSPGGKAVLGNGFHIRYPEAQQKEALVVMTADDSPHTMASQVYLSGNAAEPIDVHYVGGTTVLMHTPCDVLSDNFYNTLTEEGPMLSRAVERSLAFDESRPAGLGSGSRVSLLLENRCAHHAYRDELRDMLIGRDHAVWKVLPSSWTCVERLITPPDPPRKLERSLQRYAQQLKGRAQEQRAANEKFRNSKVRGRGKACRPDAELDAAGTCKVDWETMQEIHASSSDSNSGLDPPLRIVVVQRTGGERRITNLDKVLTGLKRKLSTANFTNHDSLPSEHLGSAGARAVPFVELLVRRATVEAIHFEGLELWEQIDRMRNVDVLIGVTGSGLTNLAFLEPGALVIELAAKTYEQTYFDTLVMRVHGSLIRGTIAFRKSYVTATYPEAASADVHNSGGVLAKAYSGGVQAKAFDAKVNVTDVTRIVLEELQHRAHGWWRASDG